MVRSRLTLILALLAVSWTAAAQTPPSTISLGVEDASVRGVLDIREDASLGFATGDYFFEIDGFDSTEPGATVVLALVPADPEQESMLLWHFGQADPPIELLAAGDRPMDEHDLVRAGMYEVTVIADRPLTVTLTLPGRVAVVPTPVSDDVAGLILAPKPDASVSAGVVERLEQLVSAGLPDAFVQSVDWVRHDALRTTITRCGYGPSPVPPSDDDLRDCPDSPETRQRWDYLADGGTRAGIRTAAIADQDVYIGTGLIVESTLSRRPPGLGQAIAYIR